MQETDKLKVARYAMKNNTKTPLTYQEVSEKLGFDYQKSMSMLSKLGKDDILYKSQKKGWLFNSKFNDDDLVRMLGVYTFDELTAKNGALIKQ